ncbi:MAG TPA: 50S ribosomal protein L9 [Thermoanaerobaculia bacterium]|nr:50S ribosomal protein L9 [Thermoanaerobaculia bacterium]HUM31006.1 50S ribosomal protein L9 [Thermoanaerobaculia bacterium]HXK69304.1 50S ribosomal protein L9 [Thermoanaerobaculia bacterium]
MKIILIEDFETLGHQGDVIDVKPGYARNFLIPKNLAWEATKGNMKRLEQQKKVWEVRLLRERDQAEKLKSQVEEKILTFEAKAGEEGHLYGSITASDIAEKFEAMHIIIDKRRIHLAEPIRRIGSHDVTVKLHRDVEALVKVEVKSEGGETTSEEPS